MKLSKALFFQTAVMAPAMLLVLWTSPVNTADAATAKAKSNQSEAVVRGLIEEHCGTCHNSTRQTAKPAALKVFDLNEDDWTASMSNDQLQKVMGRVNGVNLPPAKRQLVASFIKGKLEQRAAQNH
jgi:mono/diheme cytochrome c family protein